MSYIDIVQYSTLGDITLLEDFNVCTKAYQIPLHDKYGDAFLLHNIDLDSMDLQKTSNDTLGPFTTYDKHILHFGESHKLVILNVLPCFPYSNKFTCFPHNGRTSVVNYVPANQDLLPYIHQFFVTLIPLADHSLLSFSLKANHYPPPLLPPLAPLTPLFYSTMGIQMPSFPTSDNYSLPSLVSHSSSQPPQNTTISYLPFGMRPLAPAPM